MKYNVKWRPKCQNPVIDRFNDKTEFAKFLAQRLFNGDLISCWTNNVDGTIYEFSLLELFFMQKGLKKHIDEVNHE